MLAYRILARLLSYPEPASVAAMPEIAAAIAASRAFRPEEASALGRLAGELAAGDLLELQERYVALFDRTRSLSLHLFEHVHGDSRARGQAMIDLIALYRQHGYDVTAAELPDYLPLFLEFLSLIPAAEAREHLADAAHVLAAIAARLAKRASPYASVFQALVRLSDAAPASVADVAEEDEGFAEIDRAWEEAAVTFGPDSPAGTEPGGTNCDRAAEWLRRMGADRVAPARHEP